jgi:benzoyl-CoA reductase/2-hydroxyglutaryl-CoA dehydratase subunit BcrC/BadD/HgdB
MKEFELKLGATTYKCTSNTSNATAQNWNISANFHDLRLDMQIPISSKVSMDKVLVFISSLDEALKRVQQEKGKELTFITQLT